ncbi:MAG: SDR family NAD(P)-dependent oxidoreductase [Proteobacteria bacterium]|nr:SDR family NAD(P)-dependent oxidoreductase [Pseudomonadota bacterium]
MYIIAGSTGTLGSAIAEELSKNNDIFLIGRDEKKLKEQSSKYNCDYEVIDLFNTPEPREFTKVIDSDIEIKGLVNCIGSILIKPLHGTSLEEFNDVITTNLFSSYFLWQA